MKVKLFILLFSILFFSTLYADNSKSVSFIVTGNVRAEFNLCG